MPYLFLNGPEGYVSELFVPESERGKARSRTRPKNTPCARCAGLCYVPSYVKGSVTRRGEAEKGE